MSLSAPTAEKPSDRSPQPAALAPMTPTKSKPVVLWAYLGAAFLVLEAYIVAAWILSGDATRTPTGTTPLPGWMKATTHGWEIGGLVVLAIFIHGVVIRPWRREGHITLDGMLTFVCLSLYWQDPLVNYTQTFATYNAAFINFGSWGPHIPGWLSPNGNLFAEPVFWTAPVYVYLMFGGVILAGWVMRKAHERWPRSSRLRLFLVAWAFLAGMDLLWEPLFMRLGFFSYGSSIRWLTLNHGHYYQFPVYESLLFGACWATWATLRYFRDDKGRTMVERGADDLRTSPKRQTLTRYLALTGAFNAIYLAVYCIPFQIFPLHADAWPADIQNRSYLTNGLCGPNTSYACPGQQVPIPRPDSARVGPTGDLVPTGRP